MAHTMGCLGFSVLRLRRKLVLKNLRIAFPEKSEAERIRIGAASYYHFCATVLEFLSVRNGTLGDTVTIRGEENLRQVLVESRGVYIICGHQGNWEAMAAAVSSRICIAHVVVKPVGSAGTNRFVLEMRAHNHVFCIERKKKGDGMRGMIETVRRNEVVGFMIDQARPGAPFLPFFGKPAKTNTSMAYIWSQQKAPLLSAFTYRLSFGQHEVLLSPPLDLKETGDLQADLLTHSGQFNAAMETIIRAQPEQYFWMHNRWKK
jgi:KDO2-lipid IV(A) lauroyltransferase